jgi:hypothetical protein
LSYFALISFSYRSIGWAHGKDRTVRLDDYESTRPPRRQQLDLVLTRQDREDILLEWGASFSEIIEAIRSNVKAKNQRRNTVNTIGRYDRWEEMMEKAGRKLKRTILLKKSSSSAHKNKVEAYMYALQQQQQRGGGGIGGHGEHNQHHHHHLRHRVVMDDEDDVTVYTTMPMHDQQHQYRRHYRPPQEIVSHRSAGSFGNNSSPSCATPDTIPAANPVVDPSSIQGEDVHKCRKVCCLEANAQVPQRRSSDRSACQEVDAKELITDDDDDDDDEYDDTKGKNNRCNDKDASSFPVEMNETDIAVANNRPLVCTMSCCIAPVDGDNGVNNSSINRESGAHQAGQQQELSRQEMEELMVDPNAPLVEVDLLSQPSLPSYYSFSDDVSEYYLPGPHTVREDDDDDDIDDDDDVNGGPMMTMNDWHILQTIQSGYALGHNNIRVVDAAAAAGANNSSGSSSSDVDHGFTSLHRDTSHWVVGGNGLDAPRICRRFVPTIICEDENVMPQDMSSSPPRMNLMHLSVAAGRMNDNSGPAIFHHGGTGLAINENTPAIFHYTAGGGALDAPPHTVHHHVDGPPIFHDGNHHAGAAAASPALHQHHHRIMIEAAQHQQTATTSQPLQYRNQGFFTPIPSPSTSQHAPPFPNSQYMARWE